MRSRLVRTLSLFILLAFARPAHAQYTRITSGTAAPSGGVDGNIYIRTGATSPGFYINISGWIGPFNTPIGNVTTAVTLTAGKTVIGNGTTAIAVSALTAQFTGSSSGTLAAAAMTTARLLGRTTASTGAVEEITVGTGLSLSAGSLTATGGGTVTSIATTSPITGGTITTTGTIACATCVTTATTLTAHAVALGNGGVDLVKVGSLGTSGQVLTSNGAGADPSWQAAAATGSWIPLVDGSEPPAFITDGAGVLVLIAYP